MHPLLENKPAVLLYFYNDTCQPCVALRPKVAELLDTEFPLIEGVFVNAATEPELTASFGVFASPTLIILFEGKEFRRYSKYISLTALSEELSRPYALMFEE